MKRRGDEKARDEETRGWGEDGGGYRTVGGGRGRTDEGARPDVRGGAGGGTDERTRGRWMRGRGDEGTTGDERTRKGTRFILTIIYIIYLFKITLGDLLAIVFHLLFFIVVVVDFTLASMLAPYLN